MSRFYILTPTHSRATLLRAAIDSVLSQTYPDWQMFIMDDGSGDDTPALLSEFEDDERIHSWRFEKNRGVNAARNFLLDRIIEGGDPGFVVILDDDDTLEKDCLANFAKAASEFPDEGWFIANCHFPSGEIVSKIRGGHRPLCYVRDHKLGNQLSGDVAHAFHTSIIDENRFIESFPNSEEWWFYSGLAKTTKMFALDFHAKTVDYLEDGLTLQQPNKKRAAEVYSRKLERFDPFLSRSQRASIEARLGRHLYARGERRAGLRMLADAFLHWPFEHRIYVCLLEILVSPLRRSASPNAENP